ncbi:hypothetical protein [Hydrogenimonas urashimensis]|uniref:hypothetical protein n=1 Tax=Hydrogenimonas urashimensis TaxID=2740515 RepID=UPI0019165CB0|nr:hypothetical protein [Hydrogenimonas urashimensis]
MDTLKSWVTNRILSDPLRYGTDEGDLRLINDYFRVQGWRPLTRQMFKAVQACIRYRNYFLLENETFDLRKKRTALEPIGQQATIWDYLPQKTANDSKKLVKYWVVHPDRLHLSDEKIKEALPDVADRHITAARVMYPLLKANPPLKVEKRKRAPKRLRINGGGIGRKRSSGEEEAANG